MHGKYLFIGHGRGVRRRQRPAWESELTAKTTTLPKPAPLAPASDDAGHQSQLAHAGELDSVESEPVLLLGAGSVGGRIAQEFARYGLHMDVVDPDTVDTANLVGGRTVYRRADRGQLKVEALQALVEPRHLSARITPYPYRLEAMPDAEVVRLIDRCRLAVVAIDHPPSLLRFNALVHQRKPAIYIGIHRGGCSGHVVISEPSGPCLRCSLGLGDGSGQQIESLSAEPAWGFDIARVSDMAAWMGMSLLLEQVQGRPLNRWDRSKSIVYVTNQVDEASPDGPGHHWEPSQPDPTCPVCGQDNERSVHDARL